MTFSYISALSALVGSIIGGLTSGMTTWLSLRTQAKAGLRAHDKSLRSDLYKDFAIAASTAYGEAIISNDPNIQDIIALYAIINRMRILSSPRTIVSADKVISDILYIYFAENKSVRELHELMKTGGGAALDLLKDFSDSARVELHTI